MYLVYKMKRDIFSFLCYKIRAKTYKLCKIDTIDTYVIDFDYFLIQLVCNLCDYTKKII